MKSAVVALIFAVLVSSCMSHQSSGSASSVRKWKPVKDRTSYQKTVRQAEKD
ncbi:MAG: hypothetical protein HOP08_08745 [Cyclobacteriaceae bacterium]|nr:hypothetical protein [Cyclobacteriaceae bacterium]